MAILFNMSGMNWVDVKGSTGLVYPSVSWNHKNYIECLTSCCPMIWDFYENFI